MTSVVPYTGDWSPEAFAGKVFVNVDFSHRSLVGADFSNSLCRDCDFSGSDLSLANFTNANLYRSNLNGAVLYAANVFNANLTRATFIGSYSYGWFPDGSTNVTYAKVLQFDVERRRRSNSVGPVDEQLPDVRVIKFGSVIEDSSELCRQDYQVGMYRFSFTDQDRRERAMQRSQVFNRLKRMYRENQSGEPALHCLYYERFYLTRSFYRYSPLSDGERRSGWIGAIFKTATAFAAEITSGYGLKPLRVIRSLILLFALFVALTAFAGQSSSGAGVQYTAAGVSTASGGCAGTFCGFADLHVLLFYGIESMVSPDPAGFITYGWMAPVSLFYFMISLAFFALLFSSLFLRLLNE